MRVFVTGVAGFIGFHVTKNLLEHGHQVFGYDSVNDYYDTYYKKIRLNVLKKYHGFCFSPQKLENKYALQAAFKIFKPTHVIHLAAQAGVRYSIENPDAYIQSNIVGFQNVIDLVKEYESENFIYASSSSVYGSNTKLPFSEDQETSSPISLYAATKASNELVAKTYGHLFKIPSTGLRFFTVYGEYGRPDMAMFKFAEALLKGKPLDIYNDGNMFRDFTYIRDIVDGIILALFKPEISQIYNLGRGKTESLLDMIDILEDCLRIKADYNFLPMQPGDVKETSADISKAQSLLGYSPKVNIQEGIENFARWYLSVRKEH